MSEEDVAPSKGSSTGKMRCWLEGRICLMLVTFISLSQLKLGCSAGRIDRLWTDGLWPDAGLDKPPYKRATFNKMTQI